MVSNPVRQRLGRRLRLGVIGGGSGSFIGEIHRTAARLDDRYEVVASVLSSKPEKSRADGLALGLEEDRAYGSVEEMLTAEAGRENGIDCAAIMSPNGAHAAQARAALDHGLDVICDKPLATRLEDARDLVARARDAGLVFCVTYNYTGYPMVREARAMVRSGALGAVRMVRVEYVQGHNADPAADDAARLGWRLDPLLTGPSLILGDIGSHAHHLARFVSGREIVAVCADVGAVVPGRSFDDYAATLLRFDNGARGIMWVTQAAAGAEHGLTIRVLCEKGGLEWRQEFPNQLQFSPLGRRHQVLSRGGPELSPAGRRHTRVSIGHPEGFHEAFANIYADAAEAMVARRTGAPADPLALDFPTVEDGAKSVAFIEAAVASSRAGGVWTDCDSSL